MKSNSMLPNVIRPAFFSILLMVAFWGCTNDSLNQLRANSQKWKESETNHYRISLFINCWCDGAPLYTASPFTVEVKNGEVRSVADREGNLIALGNESTYSYYADLFTIDGLFEYARLSLSEADEAHIIYDPDKGFPTVVDVDWNQEAGYDDNMYITVEHFEVLP